MRSLPTQSQLPKETILSFPWLSRDGSSLLVPITAVKRGGPKQDKYHFSVEIDMYKYGFDQVSAIGPFTINKLSAYEGQQPVYMGTQNGKNLKIDYMLDARDVVLLEIRPGSGPK